MEGINLQIVLQLVLIIGSVTAMFVWAMRTILKYFINKTNEKDAYITQLVTAQQTNVENFVNTINHQRTKDREMQERHIKAIGDLRLHIDTSNKINERLLTFIGSGRKSRAKK